MATTSLHIHAIRHSVYLTSAVSVQILTPKSDYHMNVNLLFLF